ncbi:MAG: HAMP domain-containing histidine kinase, partial [Magnetospirillum sp. WYHS-4]
NTLPDLGGRNDEIGDLALALQEMTQALWDRLDAIDRFAADVAHEIKNPLSSLRSAVETVQVVSDPAQKAKLMTIIQDDVKRLDRLISDISEASRLDAELSRAEMTSVDLADMLEALVDVHAHTAPPGAPRLTLECSAAAVVDGMEDRLVRVFRNLIGNAISFSPAGSEIHLTVAAGPPGMAEVCVEDQGPGIPAGKEEAIFERFYSERPKGEKFGTHSGLGLSISRQIVEAHNGTIFAENRLEGGARFVVRLPLNPTP